MAKANIAPVRSMTISLILVTLLSMLPPSLPASAANQEISSSKPASFGKASPGDGSSGISTAPILDWADASGSIRYEYCLDFMVNGHCDSHWIATNTVSQATADGLLGGMTYEWQVKAVNADGYTYADDGTWWTFSTLASPDDPYEADDTSLEASPITDGEVQDHRITPIGDQDWVTFTLSGSSAIQLSTSGPGYGDTILELYQSDGTELIESDDDSGEGSYSAIDRECGSDPLPAGTYFARVHESGDNYPINAYMLSLSVIPCYPRVFFVSIPLIQGHPTPNAFGKITPTYDQSGVSSYPYLDWEDAPGASEYEYCLDTILSGPCSGTWVSTGDASEVYLTTYLEHEMTYRWQVRASNALGTTYADDGTPWSFTIAPSTAYDTILTAEDFEGTFPQPGWSTFDWGYTGGEYLPAKRDCNVRSGNYSGWMIGGGADGSNLPCGALYKPHHDTWLIYGPFSTKGATSGLLLYDYYMNNNDDIWDYLWVLASDNYDSNEWWGNYYHHPASWRTDSIRLSDHLCNNGTESCLNRDEVWIAFDFLTDGYLDSTASYGAMIDNIVLTLCMAESCIDAPASIHYAPPVNPLMDFAARWADLLYDERGVRADFHP